MSERRLALALAVVVTLGAANGAGAQDTPAGDLKAKAGKIAGDLRARHAAAIAGESTADAVKFVLRPAANAALYLPLLAPGADDTTRAVNLFRTEVDEARVDKQVGAGASSGGSTSLTSKGSVPAILGFAVENGALERNISGTAITFRGRPVQIVQALQKTPFAQSFKQIEANASLGALNRFSFGFTFDTSRDNAAAFTASSSELASYSVHFDVINYRDPRNRRFDARWAALQAGVAQEMALKLYSAYAAVLQSPEFQGRFAAWLDETAAAVAPLVDTGRPDSDVEQAVEQRLAVFPSADGIPGADVALRGFADATKAMFAARAGILDYVSTSPIVSIEFVSDRAAPARPGQFRFPDTSTLNIVAELAPFSGGSFTLNGSATIFNTEPVTITAARLRHAEVSAQLDIPVNPSVSQIGNVVLSFAFKYKHIPNDVLALAGTAPAVDSADAALRGDILLGQAKLTFPVKGSGVKIPLSVTFANRSELVKETVVRANLGLTFDMDTIIGRLKP